MGLEMGYSIYLEALCGKGSTNNSSRQNISVLLYITLDLKETLL